MPTTSEHKEELLAEAIKIGDLEGVRKLVEVQGCLVRGPGPWNQVPLGIAARYGHIDIIDYLVSTRLGAVPDESTLRAAIEANRLNVVMHLIDHHDLDWTAREYEFAFATYHTEMLKYAFERAIEEGWFEEIDDAETRDLRFRIVQAARDTIAKFGGSRLCDEILAMVRKRGRQGALFLSYRGADEYSFLFNTIENRPNAFPAVWEIVHEHLFGDVRYGALDGYVAKPLVDELFRKAIISHSNTAFYVLLQYALPQFKQAIALAVESGNHEIAEYLAHCCE